MQGSLTGGMPPRLVGVALVGALPVYMGATGFDIVGLNWGASRGLLNHVKPEVLPSLIGKTNTGRMALAA